MPATLVPACTLPGNHVWRPASGARGMLACNCGASKPMPPRSIVNRYRVQNPAADVADLIMWLIGDTDYRDWSPSELARAVGCTTPQAHDALRELVKLCLINTDGRGAISRYWNLRNPG